MALRLRRGTNADRLTVTPSEGELLYTTDTKKIYAGDGATVGGNIVSGINNLIEDLTPQLGGDLDLNSKTIVGNGNINIIGDITASGTLTVPNIITDVQGSIFGDDSTPLVDGANNKIVLSNNILNDIGNVDITSPSSGEFLSWNGTNWINSSQLSGNLTGDVTGNLTGNVTGNVTGNLTGDVVGDVTGNLTGNVTGNVTGNLTGDVVGDVTGNLTGNVTGDVTGDVVGDVTGNLTGNVTGNVTGDVIGNLTGDVTGNLTGNVTGNLTGNLTGDVTGNVDGDVKGSIFSEDSIMMIDGLKSEITAGDFRSSINFDFKNPSNRSELRLVRSDGLTAGVTSGAISFRSTPDDGFTLYEYGRVVGGPLGIFIVHDSTGSANFPVETTITFTENGIGVGTYAPSAALDVKGAGIITGGLTADVTGSLFSDSSLMLIDGTDGKLMAANIDVIGETGNTPVDTVSVDSWLELTVNGATKYMPLYN